MTTAEIDQTVEMFKYYDNKLNKVYTIKPPRNVYFHHYICLILTTVFEVFNSTYFIIPILSIVITHELVIRKELISRVIARCVSLELDSLKRNDSLEIPNEEKEDIFKISFEETNETGFMYTRSALLIKSAVLLFLIYYATIGLSI